MHDATKIVKDLTALKHKLNAALSSIGFGDEGKVEALFIETRELIKKYYGENSDYMNDYKRIRQIKASYSYQLRQLIPVLAIISELEGKRINQQNK